MYGLFEIDRTAVLNWITRLSFNCNRDSANKNLYDVFCIQSVARSPINESLTSSITSRQSRQCLNSSLSFISILNLNSVISHNAPHTRWYLADPNGPQLVHLPCITIQSMSKSTGKKYSSFLFQIQDIAFHFLIPNSLTGL